MFNFSFKPNRLIFRSSESPTSSSEGVSPKTTMQELSTVLGKGLHEIKKGETTIQAIKRVLNKLNTSQSKQAKIIKELSQKYKSQLQTADQETKESLKGAKPRNTDQRTFFNLSNNRIVISHFGGHRFSAASLIIQGRLKENRKTTFEEFYQKRQSLKADIKEQYYQKVFFKKGANNSLIFQRAKGWRVNTLRFIVHPNKNEIIFKPKGVNKSFALVRIQEGRNKGEFKPKSKTGFPQNSLIRGRVSIRPGDAILKTSSTVQGAIKTRTPKINKKEAPRSKVKPSSLLIQKNYQKRFFSKDSEGALTFKKTSGWRTHSLKHFIPAGKNKINFKPAGSNQSFVLTRITSGPQKGQFETDPKDRFPSKNIIKGRVAIYPGDQILSVPRKVAPKKSVVPKKVATPKKKEAVKKVAPKNKLNLKENQTQARLKQISVATKKYIIYSREAAKKEGINPSFSIENKEGVITFRSGGLSVKINLSKKLSSIKNIDQWAVEGVVATNKDFQSFLSKVQSLKKLEKHKLNINNLIKDLKKRSPHLAKKIQAGLTVKSAKYVKEDGGEFYHFIFSPNIKVIIPLGDKPLKFSEYQIDQIKTHVQTRREELKLKQKPTLKLNFNLIKNYLKLNNNGRRKDANKLSKKIISALKRSTPIQREAFFKVIIGIGESNRNQNPRVILNTILDGSSDKLKWIKGLTVLMKKMGWKYSRDSISSYGNKWVKPYRNSKFTASQKEKMDLTPLPSSMKGPRGNTIKLSWQGRASQYLKSYIKISQGKIMLKKATSSTNILPSITSSLKSVKFSPQGLHGFRLEAVDITGGTFFVDFFPGTNSVSEPSFKLKGEKAPGPLVKPIQGLKGTRRI